MIDPIVEQDIIVAAVDSAMAQTVYEGVPDATLENHVNGVLVPYIAIDFGTPIATANDRGIVGEQTQPYSMRVAIACVGPTSRISRQISGKIAQTMTGFKANPNSGHLRMIGGASYTVQFSETLPTSYISEAYFSYVSNMDV